MADPTGSKKRKRQVLWKPSSVRFVKLEGAVGWLPRFGHKRNVSFIAYFLTNEMNPWVQRSYKIEAMEEVTQCPVWEELALNNKK